jgi:hypothetical protein
VDWPLDLRPLPRHVAPVPDETITSYLTRLAEANRLDPAALRHLLSGSHRKNAEIPFAAVVAVSGIPASRLAFAMPQICTPAERAHVDVTHRPRPRHLRDQHIASRPCTAAASGGRPVTVWALHEHVVCSPHRRWLSEDEDQPDLSRQPEILDAARRHRWLIRRHGRDTVMRAHRDARSICVAWRLDGIPDDPFDRRMVIFHGPHWREKEADTMQTFDAAIYPQAVALTRLLASPYWRQHFLKGWRSPNTFMAELRRTVAPNHVWGEYPRIRWQPDRDDPLLDWLIRVRRAEYEPPPDGPWLLPETLDAHDLDGHERVHAAERLGPETWDTSGRQTVPRT